MNHSGRRSGQNGHYGVDELGRLLMGIVVILLIIELFAQSLLLTAIIAALIIWTLFRMLSGNIAARQAENQKYAAWKQRMGSFFQGGAQAARDPDHVYFRCPKCHQKVRVPRGKGHIQITCPRCHTQFIKET